MGMFSLITRFAVRSNFSVEEVLFLRLVPGALVMFPTLRLKLVPPGQLWPRALVLIFGASAVFPYIVLSGLAFAPASDGGVLTPGILPFWTELAAYALVGERPSLFRKFGLVLILVGALIIGLW